MAHTTLFVEHLAINILRKIKVDDEFEFMNQFWKDFDTYCDNMVFNLKVKHSLWQLALPLVVTVVALVLSK